MMMIGKDDRVEEAEEGSNWSELPGELLALIGQRLIKLKDGIRIRAVCKRWRKTLTDLQPVMFRQSSRSPLLMLPYCNNSNNEGEDAAAFGCSSQEEGWQCRLFLDVAHNQYHHIDFAEGFEKTYCRGSAFGWLFMLQHIPVLLNPLTGKQILLPPISSLPDMLEYNPEQVGHEYFLQEPMGDKIRDGKKHLESIYMQRFAMSADPTTSEDDCIVMTIRNNSNSRLAFCRLGGDKWTLIPHPDGTPLIGFMNIVFLRDRFYALNTAGRVLCCDLSNSDVPSMSFLSADVDIRAYISYLLVGPDDELMMVTKSADFECKSRDDEDDVDDEDDYDYEDEDDVADEAGFLDRYYHNEEANDQNVIDVGGQHAPVDVYYLTDLDSDAEMERCRLKNYRSSDFMVYRLNEDTRQWEPVHSIGDFAFFLGTNAPTCLSTKDCPEFTSNCIYFTDDVFDTHVARRFG